MDVVEKKPVCLWYEPIFGGYSDSLYKNCVCAHGCPKCGYEHCAWRNYART